MMKLSTGDDGQPSLDPAEVLGEPIKGDLVEFSPDGSIVALVTIEPKLLK